MPVTKGILQRKQEIRDQERTTGLRTCSKCGQALPLTMFAPDRLERRHPHCRPCRNAAWGQRRGRDRSRSKQVACAVVAHPTPAQLQQARVAGAAARRIQDAVKVACPYAPQDERWQAWQKGYAGHR